MQVNLNQNIKRQYVIKQQNNRTSTNNSSIYLHTKPANNNPSFTGIRLSFLQSKTQKAFVNNLIDRASYYLGVPPQRLQRFATPDNPKRTEFFYALTENLISDLHKTQQRLPENAEQMLGTIFAQIKKPNEAHFTLLENKALNFKDKAEILKLSAQKPENIHLLNQLQSLKGLNDYRLDMPADTIISLLSLKQTEKLSKKFENFRSYIILNHTNLDFTKNLTKELNSDTLSFSPASLDKTLLIKQEHQASAVLRELPEEFLEQNYNALGLKLLGSKHQSIENLLPANKELSKKDIDFFKYLLNTTTKDNFELRQKFFQTNSSFINNKNLNEDIMIFFKRLDTDKNFQKAYEYVSQNSKELMSKPIKEFMFYNDIFGSDVIAQKIKNFTRIINSNTTPNSDPNKIAEILSKNLNNRFYVTKSQINRAREEEYNTRINNMFFGETKAKIKRAKRILSFEIMPTILGKGEVTPFKQKLNYETYRLQNSVSEVAAEVMQQPASETTIKEVLLQQPKIKIKRDYKAQKLQIQKEGQEIIKQRMRSKKDYGQNIKRYTKMRNAFLNEMFDSVKQTRAQERAKGVKRPAVSNKDVIDLYSKIKGKNQKLVRALLKKRTAGGNREYNVKEIAAFLDKIETYSKTNGLDQKAVCDTLTKQLKESNGNFKLEIA